MRSILLLPLLLLSSIALANDAPLILLHFSPKHKDARFCIRGIRFYAPTGSFPIALQDDIGHNTLTTAKTPYLGRYCIDKFAVAHATLMDCSDMTRGFCNGNLYIDGKDLGVRKEGPCGCDFGPHKERNP